MTAPILSDAGAQRAGEGSRKTPARLLPSVLGTPPAAPTTLICSGLTPSELDEIPEAFRPTVRAESDRRLDGDWAALLLAPLS